MAILLDDNGNTINNNSPQNIQGLKTTDDLNKFNISNVYPLLRKAVAYPESGIAGLIGGVSSFLGGDGFAKGATQELDEFQNNANTNGTLENAAADPANIISLAQPELSPLKAALYQGLGQVGGYLGNTNSPTLSGGLLQGGLGALASGIGHIAGQKLEEAGDKGGNFLNQLAASEQAPKILEGKTVKEATLNYSPDVLSMYNSMGVDIPRLRANPDALATDYINISKPNPITSPLGGTQTKILETIGAGMLHSHFPSVLPLTLAALGTDYVFPKAIPYALSKSAPIVAPTLSKIAPLFSGIGADYLRKYNF